MGRDILVEEKINMSAVTQCWRGFAGMIKSRGKKMFWE